MKQLKDIRSFDDLKEFVILNKETIKKAALPVTVAAALLFFWVFGGSGEGKIQEEITPPAAEELEENQEETSNEGVAANSKIYVDISGFVTNPGVYRVTTGTRLFEVIEKAGGLKSGADIKSLNRAEEVYDGQKIIIYSEEEASQAFVGSDNQTSGTKGVDQSGKVNINTANSGELESVPGIGPATAEKIIQHREKNGRFKTVDELTNVSGIGNKTLENMREYITV